MPDLALRCIASWKKYLPDYEIKRWDESNFDVNVVAYTKGAAQEKKWAFVSDYARFYILYTEGGIYLDVDVELLKGLDDLLNHRVFMGFESSRDVAPGLIVGAEKGMPFMEDMLKFYNAKSFYKEDGTKDLTTVVTSATNMLVTKGLKQDGSLQQVNEVTIYPSEYFSPISAETGDVNVTEKAYSIHHYAGSWVSRTDKLKMKFVQFSRKNKNIQHLLNIYRKLK